MHSQFFQKKSRFSTICETIGNFNPLTAMLIPVLGGAGMVVLGFYLECQGQSYLLKQGSDAVINYYYSIDTDLNFVEYIGYAFRWQLNSLGEINKALELPFSDRLRSLPLAFSFVVHFKHKNILLTRNELGCSLKRVTLVQFSLQ
jgi:hypothetical protein